MSDLLQIEDLKRHAQSEMHIEALRRGPHAAAAADSSGMGVPDQGTPTAAQIRLAVECLRRARSGQTVEYQAKAELAGRADSRNFPLARSNGTEFSRIMAAAASVLRDEDRSLMRNVVAAAISEDVSKDYLGMRIVLVDKTFRQHVRCLEYRSVCGKKATTLDKVGQIQEALQRFCPEEADRAKLQKVVKVFAADGEKAESWAGRVAKVKEVLPNLQATTRCCMHSAQRAMESAVKSDPRCEHLLNEVVLKYSKPGDNKQPGSLARALASSSKLAGKFKRHTAAFNSIDELMGKASEAPHFAAQRFDSIYEIWRSFSQTWTRLSSCSSSWQPPNAIRPAGRRSF
ncbi:unnamed protein product [Symbiodinium sp. CCMP2592]|nr:unnamed protein product [Symbiodinium sp. CCMP2592]